MNFIQICSAVAIFSVISFSHSSADNSKVMGNWGDVESQIRAENYFQAINQLKSSYVLAEREGNRPAMARASGDLGLAYAGAGEIQKAADEFEKSRKIASGDGDAITAALSAYNFASLQPRLLNLRPESSQWFLALELGGPVAANRPHLESFASIAHDAFQLADQAHLNGVSVRGRTLLVTYGGSEVSEERALNLLQYALKTATSMKDKEGLLLIADAAVGRLIFAEQSSRAARESFSKVAMRASSNVLNAKPSLDQKAKALGILGRLYAYSGDIDAGLALTGEALLTSDEDAIAPSDMRVQPLTALELHAQQALLFRRQGRADDAKRAYKLASAAIERLRPSFKIQNNISSKIEAYNLIKDVLGSEIEFLFKQYGDGAENIRAARERLELLRSIEIESYISEPCLNSTQKPLQSLDWIGPRAAVIYPIVFEDHTDVILARAGDQRRFTVQIARQDVLDLVNRFRDQVRDRNSQNYLATGRQLYDALLAQPIATLNGSEVDTLIFSPGADLRGVPLAALHDGQGFLVEKYAVATELALGMVDAAPAPSGPASGLSLGLSKEVEKGFPALPNVEMEINAISLQLSGTSLLNERMTSASISDAMRIFQPNIIHIASHGQFSRLEEENFILTYGGKFTPRDLKNQISSYSGPKGIELLTLSACETAKGNDDLVLGLAGTAFQSGARSVVGSLWQISDKSTSRLMPSLYDNILKKKLSKAQSLRVAQLGVMQQSETRHPFYWAAFVLIGSWN